MSGEQRDDTCTHLPVSRGYEFSGPTPAQQQVYCVLFTQTIYVRAEVPLSLPVPIIQHTPGPAFVQCLVIHSRAVGVLTSFCSLALTGPPRLTPSRTTLWLSLGGLEPAGRLLGLLEVLLTRAPEDHAAGRAPDVLPPG
jgi:hypothetical protein